LHSQLSGAGLQQLPVRVHLQRFSRRHELAVFLWPPHRGALVARHWLVTGTSCAPSSTYPWGRALRCAAAACVSYRACACCCFIWMVSVTSSFFCRRFGSDCGFFPRHFAGALMFCRHRDAPCAQVTIRHPAVASSAKAQCDPSVSAVTAPKEGLARFCDLIIEY
jgi:hypothetical protein